MDESERWIYLDGPEPELVRTVLDTLRDLPPATPEHRARMARAFLAKLDAKLLGVPPRSSADEGRDAVPPLPPPAPRVRPVKLAQPDPEDAEPRNVAPPAPAPPVAVAPPSAVAPSALAGTSLTLDLPPVEARGKLPFKRPEDLLPGQRSTRTAKLPVWPSPGLGDTTPLGDDSIARALAVLPFAASSDGASLTVGGMTLEQYASFRAELAVWPEAETLVLEKYQVRPPAARASLDAQWQQHLAANPRLRAVFEEKLAGFTRWLLGVRKQAEHQQK